MLDASSLIHVRFIESPLEEFMQNFLQGTGMTYTVDDKTVVIRRKHQSRTDVTGWELSQQLRVSGSVTDTTGAPLPGVSVIIKGTTNGVSTDIEGNYTLGSIEDNAVLVFSMVGFETREIPASGRTLVDVRLRAAISELEKIIVAEIGRAHV